MFSKLKKLFKPYHSNPCEEWIDREIVTPHLDTALMKVGELRFGDDVSNARIFGKPDEIGRLEGDAYNLIYAKAGLQLEFDQNKLCSVAYFVGPDKFEPKGVSLVYAKSAIDSLFFDASTSASQVIASIGEPREIDNNAEETILYYSKSKLTLEFEFSPDDQLKRVSAYPI